MLNRRHNSIYSNLNLIESFKKESFTSTLVAAIQFKIYHWQDLKMFGTSNLTPGYQAYIRVSCLLSIVCGDLIQLTTSIADNPGLQYYRYYLQKLPPLFVGVSPGCLVSFGGFSCIGITSPPRARLVPSAGVYPNRESVL